MFALRFTLSRTSALFAWSFENIYQSVMRLRFMDGTISWVVLSVQENFTRIWDQDCIRIWMTSLSYLLYPLLGVAICVFHSTSALQSTPWCRDGMISSSLMYWFICCTRHTCNLHRPSPMEANTCPQLLKNAFLPLSLKYNQSIWFILGHDCRQHRVN